MSSVKATQPTLTAALCCVLILIGGRLISATETPPNIVFIMFDDLSMSEVSYNGGMINTTGLDAYAKTGIRLNYHYSEQVCSPSRAAFMTGRYSWKSGLNSLAGRRKDVHYDRSAVLFSQLFNQAGYNVDIAGKWHIGYKYEGILPPKRGFKTGLYGHCGSGYYGNNMNTKFSKIDPYFPITKPKLKQRRQCLFKNKRLPAFDLFKIVKQGRKYKEKATNIGHTSYVDDLYAEHTRSFIANQTATTGFVTILNLYTPHSDTISPPDYLPKTFGNTSMISKYSAICGQTSITSTNKTILCKQLLYAEGLIDGIIQQLNTSNLYDSTIVIIASDNGGASTVSSGLEYADTMPLRGRKSGPFEGGTRTSLIMTGGWIENYVLGQNITNGCDYNNLVHISDWYHIFMNMHNITSQNASPLQYLPDSDHASLQIWDDIRCECGSNSVPGVNQCEGSTQANPFTQRTEMIQLQTCSTKTHPNKRSFLTALSNATAFFSTYIRKTINNTAYKLVMGGSSDLMANCTPFTEETDFNHISSYSERTGTFHKTPSWTYYTQYYLPLQAKYSSLYESQCLNDLAETNAINDTNRTEFQYSNSMLYQIADDRVEACDISSANQNVVTKLEEALQNASSGYLVSDWNADPSVGAFYAQLDSWRCATWITTLEAWEGKNETACNTSTTGAILDCNDVWTAFIKNVERCCDNNPNFTYCSKYYNDSSCGGYNESTEYIVPIQPKDNPPVLPMRPDNEPQMKHNNDHELWFQTTFSSWNMIIVSSFIFIVLFCLVFVLFRTETIGRRTKYVSVNESMTSDDSAI
eukprot:208871_1